MTLNAEKSGMKVLACIVIALLLISTGCAGTQKELLALDHTKMTNDELLKYYFELSEEIDRCVSETNKSPAGFAPGFNLGFLGIGLGFSSGRQACNTEELRKRRIAVKLELHNRGMNPENNVI